VRVVATFKISWRWIALQLIGVALATYIFASVDAAINAYEPRLADPSKVYGGPYGLALVRLIISLFLFFILIAPAIRFLHPPYGNVLGTALWITYVLGPIVAGQNYYPLYAASALAVAAWLAARARMVTYTLTDSALLIKDGWKRRTVLLSKVVGVRMNRSLAGRILGYGTVVPEVAYNAFGATWVHSPRDPTYSEALYQVPNPALAWSLLSQVAHHRDFSSTIERVLGGRQEDSLGSLYA